MAYTIYKADGTAVTVPDNAIDVEFYSPNANGAGKGIGTQLVGRNAIDYGQPVAQTFLQLTENFCGTVLPSDTTSLQGQMWFNKTSSTTGNLYVRTTNTTSGGLANWSKVLIANSSGAITVTSITATDFYGGTFHGAATALSGGATGSIPYQSAPNITTFLAAGSSSQVLVSGSAPSWTSAPSLVGTNFTGIPDTALLNGGIPSQTGQSGKFLTTNGTVTSWATTGGGSYTLPIASGSVLGGIKTGAGVAIDGSGVVTITTLVNNPTLNGNVYISGALQETANVRGSISGAQTVDISLGDVISCTISGNTTFSFINPGASGRVSAFIMEITNGGSATISWPGTVSWVTGLTPTLRSSGKNIVGFFTRDGGTTYQSFLIA